MKKKKTHILNGLIGIDNNLSSYVINNLSPDVIKNLSPDVINKLSHDVINNLSPDVIKNLSPDVIKNLSSYMINNLSPYVINNLSPDVIKNLSSYVIKNLSPYVINNLSPDVIKNLSPDVIKNLSPYVIKKLSKFKKLIDDLPVIDNPYSSLLNDIEQKTRFYNQSTFGEIEEFDASKNVCKTAMCIAGQFVDMAGPAGYAAKKILDYPTTAAHIHYKAHPTAPIFNYMLTDNSIGMDYINMMVAFENREDKSQNFLAWASMINKQAE